MKNKFKHVYARAATLLRVHFISVFVFLSLVVIGDVLFVRVSSDLLTFGILGFYGYMIWLTTLPAKITFSVCLALFSLMFILFLLVGPAGPTEKAAVWLVLFMIFGIIQEWRGQYK